MTKPTGSERDAGFLSNPAELVCDKSEEKVSECCDIQMVFALQDRYHQFSLPLETVLSCLRMAEGEGGVPELPPEWWSQVINRYNLQAEIY